jgi:hypothetical protein
VPGTIDSTGATDVTGPLNDWIKNTVPDGTATNPSIITFASGTTYSLSLGIHLNNPGRHYLTFEGNGSTLKNTTGANGASQLASLFLIGWGDGGSFITIHNFVLVGNDPTPGTYNGGIEGEAGVEVDAASDITIYGNTIRAVYGDGVKVGDATTRVSIHDNNVQSDGRNGMTIISGSNIEIAYNNFTTNGYMPFDIEPNAAGENTSFVNFHHNTIGTWTNAFFAADGGSTATDVHDVIVDSNHLTASGMFSIVDIASSPRRRNFTFTNNLSDVAMAGPVFRMSHVDGLVIQHNTQPLSSGSLLQITDSPGAITSPNP